MTRLLTALVGVPLALAAVFLFSDQWFFVVVLAVFGWAAFELAELVRRWTPRAPVFFLPVLFVLGVLAYFLELTSQDGVPRAEAWDMEIFTTLLVLSLGAGMLVLFARTPVEQTLPALGAFTFGLPYIVLPAVSVIHVRARDPYLLLLLLAIVWLGDAAAYYVGSAWGRHKMAPRVSPNKSWEGAVASLLAVLLATVVWSLWRLGRVDVTLLAVGLLTGVAAQLGDLVESMLKRGAGVKDSGNLLPGHGGVLDRMDAMLFAAPVLFLGLHCLGAQALAR